MTTMVDRPDVDRDSEVMAGRAGRLGLAVIILSILGLGLLAWIVFDYIQESSVAPTSEMTQLLDDYQLAWNEYDVDEFLELTTGNYLYTSPSNLESTRAEQAEAIGSTLPAFAFKVENIGTTTVTGDDPWYASTPVEWTTNLRTFEGISVVTIVDSDGALKVWRHDVIGDY